MLQSASQDIKQKLQLRVIVKFSEKFGGDPSTLAIIKQTLDQELADKNYISPQVSRIFSVLPIS